METINYENYKKKISTLDLEKTIFWVGCGVSRDFPTALPLGKELTDFYLEKSLGESCKEVLYDIWNNINLTLEHDWNIAFPLMRLEFIMGCINEVDNELGKKVPMLSGVTAFEDVTPNINHKCLNDLLMNKGATIISPNFDLCIEKATDTLLQFSNELNVTCININDKKTYHYHGIGSDTEHLGATISRIKKGLPLAFSNWLKARLEDGYNLVCVGFSCSDYFDVTPFFKGLKHKSLKGEAVFFEHNIVNNTADSSQYRKACDMFAAFERRTYVYGDTNRFLLDLAQIKQTETINRIVDWKNIFNDITISDNARKYYLLKISNQLGIEIKEKLLNGISCKQYQSVDEFFLEILDEIDLTKLCEHIRTNYSEDYNKSVYWDLVSLCENRKNDLLNEKVENLKKVITTANRDNTVRRDARERSFEETINKIKEIVEAGGIFDSREVYSIVLQIQDFLREYIKNIYNIEFKLKGKSLLCTLELMLKQSFVKYRYMSYYITLLRYHWQLKQVVEDNEPCENSINEYFTISGEICAIDEIIKGYISLKNTYFWRFLQKGSFKSLKKSMHYRKVSKLIEATIR